MCCALFVYYRKIIEDCVGSEYSSIIHVDPPKDSAFGDFSINLAMILAKKINRSSMDIAHEICEQLKNNIAFERLEVKKPGFINWFIPREILIRYLPHTLDDNFGKINLGHGKSINIEYVSANPTGPLHVGHLRGAISGDVLSNLLSFVGYNITREFYINDSGKQVEILAKSLYHRYLELCGIHCGELPNWAYPGEYLIETAKKIRAKYEESFVNQEESSWLDFFKEFAVTDMIALIKRDLENLGVKHDVFSSELKLLQNNSIDESINLLKNKGLIYFGTLEAPKCSDTEEWEEREQLLFKSTQFGDDTDRPLQKQDGSWTYFAADIAYHKYKIDRNFDEMIAFWGADHGGYVSRMQAAVAALSDGAKKLDIKLMQIVRLVENGCELKMSKRAGVFVSANDVLQKVGKDVIRFIMLTRRDDVPLDFDFKKAIEQSRENAIFYVQYAHARLNSVFKMYYEVFKRDIPDIENVDLNLLDDSSDILLAKIIADWPRQLVIASNKREPHRLAFFLFDLASVFHSIWNQGKDNNLLRFILANNIEKTNARMILLKSMQNVIKIAMRIIGIPPVEELK